MTKAKEEFAVGKNNIGWVDSSFIKEFGDDEITPGSILTFQTLKRNMKDSEIIKELGIQECTVGDILTTLEKATPDMKDGYANIFYVKGHSRVVSVSWLAEYGEWGVVDWDRGDYSWRAGIRVFSPATVTQAISSQSSDSMTLESAIKICKDAGLKVIKIETKKVEL